MRYFEQQLKILSDVQKTHIKNGHPNFGRNHKYSKSLTITFESVLPQLKNVTIKNASYEVNSKVDLPRCIIPKEPECSHDFDLYHPIYSLQGIPNSLIVLRILDPIFPSILCNTNPLARIVGPKIILL